MRELNNLIKMQWYSLLAVKNYILLVVVIGFITIFTQPTFIAFAGGMILMAVNYSVIAHEDKSKMGYLIHSLPVGPKKYILSKYIYGFISIVLVMIITLIIFNIVNIFNIQNLEGITLSTLLMSVLLIGVVINTVTVPVGIIVGFQKARFIITILAIAPVCFSPTLVTLISSININISESTLMILTLIAVAIFTVISYNITSKLYCRRDVK